MNVHFLGSVMRRKSVLWQIVLIGAAMISLVIGGYTLFPAHASTTRAAGTVQIDAGGPAAPPFVADTDFSGGTASHHTKTVITSGVTNPAPQAVYQSSRLGRNFRYTIPNLTAQATYTVRLHFAEIYWKAAGKRLFNVTINGTPVLTNFDIFATAGGAAIAVVEQFNATASTTGAISIQFTSVKDSAQVNGIEVLGATSATPIPTSTPGGTPATPTPTSTPGGTSATPTPTSTSTSGGSGAPITPPSEELHANSDSSITVTWTASPGATGYRIYRSTQPGAEGNTPLVSTSALSYKDANLSNKLIYYYEISAVNAAGESGRTAEDASMTPPPIGTGGNVAGIPSGSSLIFYGKDALLGGFDWFQELKGWFPQVLGSSGALAPGKRVIDMAYSTDGTMTFNNVVVSKSGLYTIDWRYAFAGGLFPSVKNRQMGLMVNGRIITSTERFTITGSFSAFQDSSLQVQLNAGVNSISLLAVSDHGVSRVDEMTVTPANASVPSGPTNLAATPGSTTVTLTWTGSSTGNPTSYTIYRGTATDGELPTPIATVNGTTTTFTDTGLHNGKTYFYNVAANNSVGVSPDSNEVSVAPN